jgi:hypothetical protein
MILQVITVARSKLLPRIQLLPKGRNTAIKNIIRVNPPNPRHPRSIPAAGSKH